MSAEKILTFAERLEQARLAAGGQADAAITSDRAEGPHGIRIPNSTQVPNEILDDLMAQLNEAEFKVLLYLVRKTFGYNKLMGDSISLSQFEHGTTRRDGTTQDKGTGLSRPSIVKALKTLDVIGLVEVKKTQGSRGENTTTAYRLKLETLTR